MDPTIRSVIGYALKTDNAVVELRCKTVDGTTAFVDVVPEVIGDLVLALMQAKTEAAILDNSFPGVVSEEGHIIRDLFQADQMLVVKEANPTICRVQIRTPGNAIFEFLVPADQMLRGTEVPRKP